MTLKERRDYPPMIEAIDKKFHVKGKPILYAWGDTVFNPLGIYIPPHLWAHEKVHCARQREWKCVEDWWSSYLRSPGFRYLEELAAHVAEAKFLMENGNRHQRRAAVDQTASRLAAPLYQFGVRKAMAKKDLRYELEER